MKKQIKIILSCVAVLFAALILWIIWANKALELNTYTVTSEKLPEEIVGFRIAHVSDLHNTQIGKDNERLLAMLKDAQPDVIAITGDLIDSRNTNITVALQFAEEAVKLAPCYYVSGNHEARISQYDALIEELTKLGVTVLADASVQLESHGQVITLIGVDDPSFQTDYLFGDADAVMTDKLDSLVVDDSTFQLLLSHRPELFPVYVQSGADLVLSGHTHGGQFRLPFIGGLFAPNQGLFPEYDAGLYVNGDTYMVVSRGVGNSIIPFRFNNRPEVIIIELQPKS